MENALYLAPTRHPADNVPMTLFQFRSECSVFRERIAENRDPSISLEKERFLTEASFLITILLSDAENNPNAYLDMMMNGIRGFIWSGYDRGMII